MNTPVSNAEQFSEWTHPLQSSENWHRLKQVITDSSGFEKWQRSRKTESKPDNEIIGDTTIDELVRCYLSETLETLAY